MRRTLTALAILARGILAQDAGEPQVPEEVIVGEVEPEPEGRIYRSERDAPAVFLRLCEGGFLEWKHLDTWKEITLRDLGTILATERDRYELEQRQAGKSVLEELPRSDKQIIPSIHADPGIPWQHVQWVMTVVSEQKIRRVELTEGNRRLLVDLPRDSSNDYIEGYEPPTPVSVHVIARAEQPAKFGDVEVLRPTVFRYKCDDSEVADLAKVKSFLKKHKEKVDQRAGSEKDRKIMACGEIKAGHKVPYAKVFDVAEAFFEAGIECATFYGTAIPPDTVRGGKKQLPYPEHNYSTDSTR